jgi:hypothetical protein
MLSAKIHELLKAHPPADTSILRFEIKSKFKQLIIALARQSTLPMVAPLYGHKIPQLARVSSIFHVTVTILLLINQMRK